EVHLLKSLQIVHRGRRYDELLGLPLQCGQDMHLKAGKPHLLAGVITNVLFTLKKGSSVRPHLVTNCYGKTVDQEKRAIGIVLCRQVSNDEMPEKNGYGMK